MRVVFLYQGPHKCHEKWAKAINADFCHFGCDKIEKADIILVEGGAPLPKAAEYKRRYPKTKIIYLNADETSIVWRKQMLRGRGISYFLSWFRALAKVNGVISVSSLVKLNTGIPELIVHPFIQKKYEEPRYNASSDNILTVGYFHEKQGIDLLVKAFKFLKKDERFKNVKLFLVGSGYPRVYANEDIFLTGFVQDISSIYRNCGVYVHAGRFQAFPVAPVEAMHYGLPVIVTNKTGVCEILDKRFVSTTEPKDIASKIGWLLLLPYDEKMRISAGSYDKSLEFLEEKKVKEFIKAFNKLVKEPRRIRFSTKSFLYIFLLFVHFMCKWFRLARRAYDKFRRSFPFNFSLRRHRKS